MGVTNKENIYRNLFKKIDLNNSGFVSQQEIGEGLRKLGYEVTEEEAKLIFDTIDLDSSGLIKEDEFVTFMNKFQSGQTQDNLEEENPADIQTVAGETGVTIDETEAQAMPQVAPAETQSDAIPPIETEEGGAGAVPQEDNAANKGAGDTQDKDDGLENLVKSVFQGYDKDGSNKLDKSEIKNLARDVCKQLGFDTIPDEVLDRFVDANDEDKDGQLDYAEFYAMAAPIFLELREQNSGAKDAAPAPEDDRVQKAVDFLFENHDFNEDGKLSADEIKEVLIELTDWLEVPQLPDHQVEAFVKHFDQNGDNAFSKSEFYTFAKPILTAYFKSNDEKALAVNAEAAPTETTPEPATETPKEPETTQPTAPVPEMKDSDDKVTKFMIKNWTHFDTDKSGLLERSEIKKLFDAVHHSLGLEIPDQSVYETYIKTFDTNSDSKFDYNEYSAFIKPIIEELLKRIDEMGNQNQDAPTPAEGQSAPTNAEEDKIKNIIDLNFAHFDKDNSGVLDRAEIKNLWNAIHKELKIETPDEDAFNGFITAFDSDGDSKFDYNEAYKFLRPVIERILSDQATKEEVVTTGGATTEPVESQPKETVTGGEGNAPAMTPEETDAHLEKIIKGCFEFVDENKTGFLEKGEIKRTADETCTQLKLPKLDDAEINALIAKYDTDADHKFDLAETTAWLKPLLIAMRMKDKEAGDDFAE